MDSWTLPITVGQDVTVAITPRAGRTLLDVLVDGASVGIVSYYTFTDVTAPHTISAVFSPPVEQYHTMVQLNILFQKMVIDMLGLTSSPVDYDAASYFVRVSWPTTGAPAWKITEDICFLRVTEEDDPINRQREDVDSYDSTISLVRSTSYTRVISLAIIFYGPNSWDHAKIVRDGIFKDLYRFPLVREKIYPLTEIVAPRRVPEPFQSQWWERIDLELRFNEGVIDNADISIIDSAEVALFNSGGLQQ